MIITTEICRQTWRFPDFDPSNLTSKQFLLHIHTFYSVLSKNIFIFKSFSETRVTKTKKKFSYKIFGVLTWRYFCCITSQFFSSFFREIEVIINLGAFLLAALPSLREVRCHFEATDQKIRKSPIFLLQHGRRTLGMEKKVIFFLLQCSVLIKFLSN